MRCITQRTYVKRVPTAKKGGIEQLTLQREDPMPRTRKNPSGHDCYLPTHTHTTESSTVPTYM